MKAFIKLQPRSGMLPVDPPIWIRVSSITFVGTGRGYEEAVVYTVDRGHFEVIGDPASIVKLLEDTDLLEDTQ